MRLRMFLSAIVLGLLLMAQVAVAQSYVYTGGSFNGSSPGQASGTATGVLKYVASSMPLYTTSTVVTNTGTRTITQKLAEGPYQSVYTWMVVNGLTGTNTSCTLSLQMSADSTATTWATVQTYTVTAGITHYGYTFTGWPGTEFRWVYTGVGTHTSGVYGGLLPKKLPGGK